MSSLISNITPYLLPELTRSYDNSVWDNETGEQLAYISSGKIIPFAINIFGDGNITSLDSTSVTE